MTWETASALIVAMIGTFGVIIAKILSSSGHKPTGGDVNKIQHQTEHIKSLVDISRIEGQLTAIQRNQEKFEKELEEMRVPLLKWAMTVDVKH